VPFISFQIDYDAGVLYDFYNVTLDDDQIPVVFFGMGENSVLDRGLNFERVTGVISGAPREAGENYVNMTLSLYQPKNATSPDDEDGSRRRRMMSTPPVPSLIAELILPPVTVVVTEPALREDTEVIPTLTMYINEYFELTPQLTEDLTTATVFSLTRSLPKGVDLNMTTGVISGFPATSGSLDDGILVIRQEGATGSFVILEVGSIMVEGDDCDVVTNGPNGIGCLNGGSCADNVTFDGQYACICPPGTVQPNCQRPSLPSASTSDEAIRLAVSITAGIFVFILALVVLYLYNRSSNTKIEPQQRFTPPPPDEWEFDRTLLFERQYLGEGVLEKLDIGARNRFRVSPSRSGDCFLFPLLRLGLHTMLI
jgi:hypothetical protein